jgi:hypothetical protein
MKTDFDKLLSFLCVKDYMDYTKEFILKNCLKNLHSLEFKFLLPERLPCADAKKGRYPI